MNKLITAKWPEIAGLRGEGIPMRAIFRTAGVACWTLRALLENAGRAASNDYAKEWHRSRIGAIDRSTRPFGIVRR